MSDEFSTAGYIRHPDTGITYQVNRALLDQTGVGFAGGAPISTTSAAAFNLTDVTTPGLAWFLNKGSNDVTIGVEITTVTEGAVFYPILIAKPGIPVMMFMDATVKGTNPLQHKTASGTSVIQWTVWEA